MPEGVAIGVINETKELAPVVPETILNTVSTGSHVQVAAVYPPVATVCKSASIVAATSSMSRSPVKSTPVISCASPSIEIVNSPSDTAAHTAKASSALAELLSVPACAVRYRVPTAKVAGRGVRPK